MEASAALNRLFVTALLNFPKLISGLEVHPVLGARSKGCAECSCQFRVDGLLSRDNLANRPCIPTKNAGKVGLEPSSRFQFVLDKLTRRESLSNLPCCHE